jgi:hypothetical protein
VRLAPVVRLQTEVAKHPAVGGVCVERGHCVDYSSSLDYRRGLVVTLRSLIIKKKTHTHMHPNLKK